MAFEWRGTWEGSAGEIDAAVADGDHASVAPQDEVKSRYRLFPARPELSAHLIRRSNPGPAMARVAHVLALDGTMRLGVRTEWVSFLILH
jgi:hypothetical protein